MESQHNCDIRADVNRRNGKPRYWCHTHKCFAWDESGNPLQKCKKADIPPVREDEKIYLDLSEWKGGVGLWGALPPVFSTHSGNLEDGIHVHARPDIDKPKSIDKTFREVYLKNITKQGILDFENECIRIDGESAKAFAVAFLLKRPLVYVRCSHCDHIHADLDWFSVFEHKKHVCNHCGREFFCKEKNISNPIIYIQELIGDNINHRQMVNIDRTLDISIKDYPGGISIWASNPGIIWSSPKPEEIGIHVHCYKEQNHDERIVDDTFGKVIIDGIELNPLYIGHYMSQKYLTHLEEPLYSLYCPNCSKPHFDQNELAYTPHKEHICEYCNTTFSSPETNSPTVSNPIIDTLKELYKNSA